MGKLVIKGEEASKLAHVGSHTVRFGSRSSSLLARCMLRSERDFPCLSLLLAYRVPGRQRDILCAFGPTCSPSHTERDCPAVHCLSPPSAGGTHPLQLPSLINSVLATRCTPVAFVDCVALTFVGPRLQYGEIGVRGFAEVLAVVMPTEKDVFIDLGSGTGKAVLMAAALYPVKKSVCSPVLDMHRSERAHIILSRARSCLLGSEYCFVVCSVAFGVCSGQFSGFFPGAELARTVLASPDNARPDPSPVRRRICGGLA